MLRPLAFAFAILSGVPAIAQAPCFDNNLGTPITLFDDQVSQPQTLGFTFPGPAGPVTTIGISSNGFIWLDGTSNNSRCCTGNEQAFLSDPPSIAAGWMDLYPPGAGPGDGVFFNTTSASAVVTWRNIPEYGSSNPPSTYQLQLFPTGEIVVTHLSNPLPEYHDLLVGVTGGNNAAPNFIDFLQLSTTPVNSGASGTAYEVFTTQPTPNYDISGRSFQFLPNGLGGYLVFERTQCRAAGANRFGAGCPAPLVLYEAFPFASYDLGNVAIDFVPTGTGGYTVFSGPNGYLNPTRQGSFAVNIGLWDDDVSAPQTMQFPFSYPGGTTNTVEISSNGIVYLQPGLMQGNPLCCDGDAQVFATLPTAAIAPLWLNLDPSAAGAVYVEHNPQNGAFLVTWYNVPEYGTSSSNTVQLALFASGAFQIRGQAGSNANHTALVGFTVGNAPAVPAGIDFSAAMPFSTNAGGVPLTLAPAPGSLPQINNTFVMDVTTIPSSATLGFMILSFGSIPNGFDLTPLGMQGCNQYVTLAGSTTIAFPVTPPGAQFQLPIPNNAAFVGLDVFGQCAAIPSLATALGVVVSNGLRISLGT